MRLIRDRRVVDDPYVHVPDDADVPEGDVIVGWARWQRDREALLARRGRIGVRVPPEAKAADVARGADALAVIAIEFPKFADGRGYSIARLLRDRFRYRGEIRAIGNVLRDQLQYLARCGFSAFEVDPAKSAEDAIAGLDDFTVFYQPAADERRPLWKRHARPGAR